MAGNLENVKRWHLLFEQSGTFKNQFKKLGLEAIDYDILNDYGQTDVQIDIFSEIEKAFSGVSSIFENVRGGDAIMAFFPCVRFSKLFIWHMQQNAKQCKGYTQEKKLSNFLELQEELSKYASLITKLALVCIRKNIPLVIENPYSTDHYLVRYWPLIPSIIDKNRRETGDWYIKPTQYFFVCCEPLQNVILDEAIANYGKRAVLDERQKQKSLISPDYARRFIRTYLKAYDAKDAEGEKNGKGEN